MLGLDAMSVVEITNWRPSKIQMFALAIYTFGFGLGFYAGRKTYRDR